MLVVDSPQLIRTPAARTRHGVVLPTSHQMQSGSSVHDRPRYVRHMPVLHTASDVHFGCDRHPSSPNTEVVAMSCSGKSGSLIRSSMTGAQRTVVPDDPDSYNATNSSPHRTSNPNDNTSPSSQQEPMSKAEDNEGKGAPDSNNATAPVQSPDWTDDPSNPRNWPAFRKWTIIGLLVASNIIA